MISLFLFLLSQSVHEDTKDKQFSTWSPDSAINESFSTRATDRLTFLPCVTLSVSRWGLKGKQGPPPAVGNRRKVYRERGQRRAGKAPLLSLLFPLPIPIQRSFSFLQVPSCPRCRLCSERNHFACRNTLSFFARLLLSL